MILITCTQGSPEWKLVRVGIPTASEFSRLVTNTIKDGTYTLSSSLPGYARELAAELFAGKTLDAFDGNTWMERGKDLEREAADYFAFTQDAELQEVGFITNDAGTCGCSPDRLVDGVSGLEIKCLKAESHVELLGYHEKHGCAPPKYTQQVQGALLITGFKSWRQLFYHPDLPPLVITQVPDMVMHASLDKAVTQVLKERDEHLAILRRK